MLGHHDNPAPTTYVGHEVVDTAGEKLGKISDVVPDPATLEPRWFVVSSGVLKHGHFVPVEGSFTGEDGAIVVPYDKETVLHAVKAHKEHFLSAEEEQELTAYYGLSTGAA